ncbi:MAG: CubicO group peptidase (beta-lactamase class C family) [Sediminicola sp.]|jgi:CubicO group peptidase (beta-lactamase class C family)|tara:strand:+ start:1830 stop:3197 length:1368 start_codon:yes stop_codon:yes gene_type:complete
MKKIVLSVTAAVMILATACQDAKKPNTGTLKLTVFSDSLFKASIDSAEIVGAAILVHQNGKTILKKSYGYASLELGTPMPSDGVFDIGSVTKQFTAAAILKLVEANKLSLDDDFTKYLKFDTKGRKVTINNLLNHTSGIPSYTEIPEFWDMSKMDYPKDSLVSLVERNEFMFEPNEALIYNNSAYFFLGLIIEEVTGQTYEQFLQQELFEPLGMKNTGYCSITEIVKNKVYGYGYSPNGLKQAGYQNHIWPYSAGSLCSTTEDLLIWMKALHNGKVLTATMYQSMISPDKLKDGSTVSYAKALVNFSNYGHKEISHGGAITGFSSFIQYYPEDDLYIITLVNTIGPKKIGRFFGYEITWKLLDKKEYVKIESDFDANVIQGNYTGVVRGGDKKTIEIKTIRNGITRQTVSEEKIDTLNVYVGNNTWMDGNDRITIANNEYRVDNIYNYYILKKEK